MAGNDILALMGHIQGQTERGLAQGQNRRLAGLASQAIGAPPEQQTQVLQQMAQVSPDAAFNAEQHLGKMADNARAQLGQFASVFSALPPEQKQEAYPKLAMQARMMGIPAPMEYSQGFDAGIAQIAQAFGGGGAQGGVHSAFRGQNGNMWVLGRDGQARDTGAPFDPNNQIIDTGQGYFGVNKTNLQAAPVMTGGAPSQQSPQPGQQFAGMGGTVDGVPIPANEQAAFQAAMQADMEGREYSIQVPPQGAATVQVSPPAMQPPQMGGAMPGQLTSAPKPSEALAMANFNAKQTRTLTPEETAAAGYRPGTIVQVDGYGNQTVRQAPAQDRQAMSEAQRKDMLARRAKVPQLQNALRGMDRIQKALQALDGAMVNTGPMDAMVMRYTPSGQELEAAVGAIQNSVLALTRVPGIGAQSDLEARIAMLQYPSLDKPPEVNRRTLEQLQFFMRDLAKAYESAIQQDAAGGVQGAAAAGGGVDDLLSKYGVR